MELLAKYKNGNYTVKLYDDGTKVKETKDDFFDAEFPDSIDLKITDYCDLNCPMCHEKSSENGKHANINEKFLNTLSKGTELAIGGGNPLSHPDLLQFLNNMKSKGVICNITINEKHLIKNMSFVQNLIDNKLVYGVGISLNVTKPETLEFAKKNQNVVFHLILGITTLNDLKKLYNQNFKILLLGYKRFGRGAMFYKVSMDKKIKQVEDNLTEVLEGFSVVSFDNLALEQLDIKNKISKEQFDSIYMGADGESTMYVDLVEKQFAVSSTSYKTYDLLEDIKEMFSVVKSEVKNKKKLAFPALFEIDRDDPKFINVRFPDVMGAFTYGEGLKDAMYMAKDCLLTMLQLDNYKDIKPRTLEEVKKLFPDSDVKLVEIEI